MTRSWPLSLSLSLNMLLIGIALVGWVSPNVPTTFNPHVTVPTIATSARIHPLAAVDLVDLLDALVLAAMTPLAVVIWR